MDALARLEPVARDLLRRVDAALVTLGAPVEHPVWGLLRRLGTTPADAVAFFVGVDPLPLADAAAALRDQADAYETAEIPVEVPWRGTAGETYAGHTVDLRNHLAGPGDDSMAQRLRATADCADDVADWYRRARDRLARALAEVLASAQAVAVRSCPAVGEVVTARVMDRVPATAVVAAADIGARVLAAAAEAVTDGEVLHHRWRPSLGELPFRRGAEPPLRSEATIEVRPA
jgi:hypothetical protein